VAVRAPSNFDGARVWQRAASSHAARTAHGDECALRGGCGARRALPHMRRYRFVGALYVAAKLTYFYAIYFKKV
jgi:hypothetical protein